MRQGQARTKVNTRIQVRLWRAFKQYTSRYGLKMEGAINVAIEEFLAKRKSAGKRQ